MLLAALLRALARAGIEREGQGRVLVACSGGVDSVSLAHAAVKLLGPDRVVLGHVDHRVRADSHEDARRVEGLGRSLGARVLTRALERGTDDEARLRRERYRFLEELRVESGAALILTAHTSDDQAETVLLGLIRRTHLAALAGIPARRGVIVRPWLGVPRSAVLAYAQRRRLSFREDPSNREPRYLRNRIRKELLPLLEERYRPGLRRRLSRMALESRREAPPLAVAAATPRPAEPSPPVAWPGISVERRPWRAGPLPDGRTAAAFDAASLLSPRIRPLRPGDRIRPFGMVGHRKLQDVLVDAKIPREARKWVWVVVDDRGEVLWVPGVLRSALAPVSVATQEVWIFTQDSAPTCDEGPERSV